MTSPSPDPHNDELRLRTLFDGTAAEPTGPQLTRLLARAAEVPSHNRTRSWLPLWVLGPALASAAAVALVLAWPNSTQDAGPLDAVARHSSAEPSAAPAPLGEMALALPTYEEVFPEGATAMFDLDIDDLDPLGGNLEGPSTEDELDAWLAATDEILSDG